MACRFVSHVQHPYHAIMTRVRVVSLCDRQILGREMVKDSRLVASPQCLSEGRLIELEACLEGGEVTS